MQHRISINEYNQIILFALLYIRMSYNLLQNRNFLQIMHRWGNYDNQHMQRMYNNNTITNLAYQTLQHHMTHSNQAFYWYYVDFYANLKINAQQSYLKPIRSFRNVFQYQYAHIYILTILHYHM